MSSPSTDLTTDVLTQIAQAKREWEVTVDALPQLVCLLDQQQRIVRANRTLERWTETPIDAVRQQALHPLLHPHCDQDPCYLKTFLNDSWANLQHGQAAQTEAHDPVLDRYLYLQTRPIAADPHQTTSFAALIIDDISPRKHMEDALRRANEELEQRVAERTRALLTANESLQAEIAERKKAELLARQRVSQLQALHEVSLQFKANLDLADVLNRIAAQVVTVLEAEAAGVYIYDPLADRLRMTAAVGYLRDKGEASFAPGDGLVGKVFVEQTPRAYTMWVGRAAAYQDGLGHFKAALALPLSGPQEPLGVLVVGNETKDSFNQRDQWLAELFAAQAAIAIDNARLYATERDQRHRLEQSQDQLIQVEKMAALGRLVGSIAHEINNPLQSVQGFLNLLGEELADQHRPEKIEQYLTVTEGEIERISDIVRRMREFYRTPGPLPTAMDEFYRSAEFHAVNLHSVLESVLELAARKLRHNHIQLEYDWADHLPPVQGHADYLKQVFLNLTLNACDAMPEGGTLRLGTAQHPPHVHIEFSDTGLGMSADTLTRLFEPLFTTKEYGSGFGLFTSYKIIEAHQGQIMVSSTPQQGSTFTIILPIRQELL